ncbi:MAG: hypothetical protein ACREM1_05075 [Longimicrobiales bacterium]
MSKDVQKLTDEMENAPENAFGCPRCGRDNIIEVSMTLVSYPVTAWTEDGSPAAFGDPEYGEGEDFDTYECLDCSREHPEHCTFDNPARLPLEEGDDDDA